jgi:outer membrane protein insertion porin family
MTIRARIALLPLILFLIGSNIQSQENYRVVDIEVVGNRVATTSLILGVCSFDKGTTLTAQLVQLSIKRLYGLGMFSDVSIESEAVTGGMKVFVVVKEVPKLSSLEFSGNKKISTKDLKEKLGLGVGGFISAYLVFDKLEKIRALYADKGYFRALVSSALTYNADSTEATLLYTIEERQKIKVDSVIVSGNLRVPASQVISKMRNRKRGFLKSSDFAQEKYEEDLGKIVEEYHKKGFIDAYVVSDSNAIDTVTNRMKIYLQVYEGPRYYFGDATFTGNDILKTPLLAAQIKFKKGAVFNSEMYEESLYGVYTAYQDIGHLHVRVEDAKTTRSDSIIDVAYAITEGLPSHINMVNIVGNTKTKDRVIRREMVSKPGQVFSRALLMRSFRDIMALNYFAKVEPVPVDLPNGDVDLELKVEEKPTGQLNAGAGYNSQDKLVGNLGVGIPNLAGNGQSLSFNVDFGKNRNSLSLSFTEPWLAGHPTLLGVDAFGVSRRYFNEYTERRQGGSVRLGRRFKWPDNYFRGAITARLERTKYHDFDALFEAANNYKNTKVWYRYADSVTTTVIDTLSKYELKGTLPGSLLELNGLWHSAASLGFTITRDSRNLPEFATKGSYFSYSLENTGGIFGGYWTSTRHLIGLSKFLPVIGKLSLSAELQWGQITSSKDDQHIFPSDRFLVGGTNYEGVVRGYDDGSLTPDSVYFNSDSVLVYNSDTLAFGSDSIPLGTPDKAYASSGSTVRVRGKYMFTSNFELKYPLVERQIYAVLFFDAGNAWLNRHDIMDKLYKSWGFGVRVAVPGIGTLGFDFGKPLDDRGGQSKGFKTHFRAGTLFK